MSNTNIHSTPVDAIELAEPTPDLMSNDDSEEQLGPLSAEEFRSVLERTNALGIQWTADVPPAFILPKDDSFQAEEFDKIQQKYPHFPYELGNVIFYALTGATRIRALLGSADEAEQKASAVHEIIIDPQPGFRREFFFKYAIKVPYFVDLDWEIVIKTFERNVREMTRIPYALLSLVFRRPINPILPVSQRPQYDTMSVAVDENLIDKLIASLTEAKQKLQGAHKIAECINSETTEAS